MAGGCDYAPGGLVASLHTTLSISPRFTLSYLIPPRFLLSSTHSPLSPAAGHLPGPSSCFQSPSPISSPHRCPTSVVSQERPGPLPDVFGFNCSRAKSSRIIPSAALHRLKFTFAWVNPEPKYNYPCKTHNKIRIFPCTSFAHLRPGPPPPPLVPCPIPQYTAAPGAFLVPPINIFITISASAPTGTAGKY